MGGADSVKRVRPPKGGLTYEGGDRSMRQKAKLGLSGALAGLVNGLFGGGGGMVMAPLLTAWCGLEQKRALATCVAVILPFCVLSAAIYVLRTDFDWLLALPYLIGGGIGGALGGLLFKRVSSRWLRRIFALFLLYGGVRYLL